MTEQAESKRFAPKEPVQLDPPKDDPISKEELARCDGKRVYPSRNFPLVLHLQCVLNPNILANVCCAAGSDPSRPTLVAIKGIVFDVTRNPAYSASGQYRGEYSRCFNEGGQSR